MAKSGQSSSEQTFNRSGKTPGNAAIGGGKLKVLFLHGLYSSPSAVKADILREEKSFEVSAVQSPTELLSSLRNPWNRLSYIVMFVASVVSALLLVQIIFGKIDKTTIAVLVSLLVAARMAWVSTKAKAVRYMMDACVSVQRQAVREFKPDIVVGSSLGGAITHSLAIERTWTGPCVLLAPATILFLRKARQQLAIPKSWKNDGVVTLIHGTKDATVPCSDSKLMCKYIKASQEYPKDDHSLVRWSKEELNSTVRNAYQVWARSQTEGKKK